MVELHSLEGVKGGIKECKFFKSATSALKIIHDNFAATTANNNGAINIWKDDNGIYHCQVQRFCQTIQNDTYHTLTKVETWIKCWLEKIK